jgi:hypothetical protein
MHDVNQVLSPSLTSLAPPFKGFITSAKSSRFQRYVTPLCKYWLIPPTSRHPQSGHLQNQAKSQHCDDRNTLSSSLFTFFLIQGGIIFTMVNWRVTVDSAKKNMFVNIILLMPETGVTDAM